MIRIEGIGELQRRVKPAVERVDAFDWQGSGETWTNRATP